jgi:disulfide bond formation protein DsbB
MFFSLSRISARAGFAAVCMVSGALVAISLVLTELLGLSPCPLCVFQRMLYLLLMFLALWGWVLPHSLRWSGGAGVVLGLGGLGVALYQSWLQAFPEESASCGFREPNLLEQFVLWAGEKIPFMFYAWGDCASNELVLLGLSIANWSAVAFLFITVLLLVMLWRRI